MRKREEAKKFFREGARYVCTKCKAKFFTKSEVEQCHDAHKDGEEIPKPEEKKSS